jgi:2-hydroxy-3-keto-5-methylthiopentenyl-1-phosphate phosphatase
MQWNIICDFDGTIALQDTTDLVLSAYALPEWEIIEQQWKQGAIGSAECMRAQVELIEARTSELDTLLDSVQIDPYFAGFVEFCKQHHLPLLVASDGVDYFIHRILSRHGLDYLPLRANKLIAKQGGGSTLEFPHKEAGCSTQSGNCKCALAGAPHARNLLIGDGQSDFCLAHQVDFTLAKTKLLEYCRRYNLRHAGFDDFRDVQMMVSRLITESKTETVTAAVVPSYASI